MEELEEELGSGMGGSGSSMDEHDDDFIEEEDEEDEVEVLDEAAPIIPSPMSAAERIKQMEERSANSRRDRKVCFNS